MRQSSVEDNYPYRIRLIAVGVILTVAAAFFLFPRFQTIRQVPVATQLARYIEELDIPATRQFESPPPPPRPSIPIESVMEDFAEDITIPATVLEAFDEWEAPPPEGASRIKFIAYDEPPYPIGGYEVIGRMVDYPDIAREARIEGIVVLQIFVSHRGFVENVFILKGLPGTGLEEAAIKAIKKVRFRPARQRDRNVGVWVSIPIHFRLTIAGIPG